MKKTFSKMNITLIALVFVLVACIASVGVLASASGLEVGEAKVELTSYTTIMEVDEEFEFAALVTLADGTTSTDVTWSSSNIDVVDFDESSVGLAYAYEEGSAIITATAEDGAFASIEVTVLDEVIHIEGVEIDPNEVKISPAYTAQLTALILPEDTTEQGVTWKSSNEAVATVDENGLVTAIAEGQAIITVTTNDSSFKATCDVTVVYEDAMLSAESLTLDVRSIGNLVVSIEGHDLEAEEGFTYEWSSSVPEVATPGANSTYSAEIYTWSFGTTIISVTVTDTKAGLEYRASASVLVTEQYFYLTGINGQWSTFGSAEAAEQAGVLLQPVAGHPNVYSQTLSIRAYEGFQIIHSDIDEYWTTKITDYWFSWEGSSEGYIANRDDMFMVTSYGVYTVTLDLNDGMAKVYINMVDVFVTEIQLEVVDGKTVLSSMDDYADIKVTLLPENAQYVDKDIKVRITDSTMAEDTEGESAYVKYTFVDGIIHVTPVSIPNEPVTIYVTVSIDDASNTMQLALSSEDVPVTSIEFSQDIYVLNLNNGGKAWEITVLAYVNNDATVKDVMYSTTDANIIVDPVTGVVSASAFGTYTVTATSVSNPALSATAQVVVYSDAFYLIGVLNSVVVNEWIALDNETWTSLVNSPFENWGLQLVDGYLQFSGEFHFNEGDLFSIVFLGMNPGTWYGAINSNNFVASASTAYATTDSTNVKILADGRYRVSLLLENEGPRFEVELIELDDAVDFSLYLYLMRAGDAWLGDKSSVDNALASSAQIDFKGEEMVVTLTYDFSEMLPSWPVFQFLTATGTEGGFADATWYGDYSKDVAISGNMWGNEAGKFWNGGSGCQFWYVGSDLSNLPTVEFTVTFNAAGIITAIALNAPSTAA